MSRRTHGTGGLRTEKRNGYQVWEGSVRVSGEQKYKILGRVRKTGTPADDTYITRAKAEERLRDFRADLERQLGTSLEDVTLRYAAEKYLAELEDWADLKRATIQDYWIYLRRHFTGPQEETRQGMRPTKSDPFFEGWLLKNITEEYVEAYIQQKRSEGMAKQTIDNHLTLLSLVFKYAVKKRWAVEDPVARIDRKRLLRPDRDKEVQREAHDAHTREEIAAVLRHAPDDYRALFTTAYYTGMRLGELQALRWKDIEFPSLESAHGWVHVTRSWSRGEETTTKNRKSRSVPMSAVVAQALAQHEIDSSQTGADDRVFSFTGCEVIPEDRVRDVFKASQKAAGVNPIRLHDTRSTFATNLWLQGVKEQRVMLYLGHADLRTTTGYIKGHHSDDDDGALIDLALSTRNDGAVVAST